MDVGRHQLAQRGVDRTMASDRTQSGKRLAHYVDAEVPSPIRRAGMAGVTVAFVLDLQRDRREGGIERSPDRRGAFLARQAHGSTLRNGRTSTRW